MALNSTTRFTPVPNKYTNSMKTTTGPYAAHYQPSLVHNVEKEPGLEPQVEGQPGLDPQG